MTSEDREIRAQEERIEQAREELGETVAELSSRADIKARAKEKTTEIGERARDATPDVAIKAAQEARRRPRVVAGFAAAAAGLMAGRYILRRKQARK
ncbi:DUF3618 domain-containing protein [Actinomadura barringtoniae]|uniref:DUF3618 domain-containing protein n=1 Tax=Actinomadura barringtoniae TaxID=1427535 RepID=A0A939T7A0_9ACTN|nr:DUF3618 domain-containing protein [Actinomadura barringtoniae]MBO2449092.1 DUF3618 domain-containing protein [Actinomadura barringtoniae]